MIKELEDIMRPEMWTDNWPITNGAFGRARNWNVSEFHKVLNEIDSLSVVYEEADNRNDYDVAALYLDLLRNAVELRDQLMYV
jgi:hypothetical protein